MNDAVKNKAHWSFWLVTLLLLIWNIMGAMNFFMQMNPNVVSSYRENEQAIIQGRPIWATVAFGLSVFGGALGCAVLLFRKSIAFHIFVASLLGSVTTVAYTLTSNIRFGLGEMIGIILLPVVISAFLVGYAKYTHSKGWLGST